MFLAMKDCPERRRNIKCASNKKVTDVFDEALCDMWLALKDCATRSQNIQATSNEMSREFNLVSSSILQLI